MSSEPRTPADLPPGDESAIQQLAAEWLARREAGMSDRERGELESWLAADPQHARAFAVADTDRMELDWPLHAGVTDAVLIGFERRERHRARRQKFVISFAVASLAAIGFFLSPARNPADLGTGREEIAKMKIVPPSTRTLPDGSQIELKDGAQFTFDFEGTERRVFLSHGTAHFIVTKNPQRPFIVAAGRVAVRAVGTAFSVELEPKGVTVLVTEGRVAVASAEAQSPTSPDGGAGSAASLATVDAGGGVVVEEHGDKVAMIAHPDFGQQLSWRNPKLEFFAMDLGEVTRTINRYNRVQIVLGDAGLERLHVSGVLRADRVDVLVAMLESDFHLKAERTGDDRIVLSAAR